MNLKLLLFFIFLILSTSLGKERKNIYLNNQKKYLITSSFNYQNYIQKESNRNYYKVDNLYISNYYIKNYVFYNIPENKILIYPKTKAIALFRMNNMIQKNIYLYHSLNKLGST